MTTYYLLKSECGDRYFKRDHRNCIVGRAEATKFYSIPELLSELQFLCSSPEYHRQGLRYWSSKPSIVKVEGKERVVTEEVETILK